LLNAPFSYLTKKGNMIWSFGAVVFSGVIFATTLLVQTYLRGVLPDLTLVRTWYFGSAILGIVAWGILSFLSYFIALLVLHSSKPSLGITAFLRVSGYALIPFAFWNVPWVGWLIPIIGVYLWIMASKHGFETNLEGAVIISLPIIVVYLFVAMLPSLPLLPFGGGLD
jgi:hypothetical protein